MSSTHKKRAPQQRKAYVRSPNTTHVSTPAAPIVSVPGLTAPAEKEKADPIIMVLYVLFLLGFLGISAVIYVMFL